MKKGQVVYHVAHPTVRGVVSRDYSPDSLIIGVFFDSPVDFNGGGYWMSSSFWHCTKSRLYDTSSEALIAKMSYPSPIIEDLEETLKKVTYDYTHIKLYKGSPTAPSADSCDHEWVTWTGLNGTITDCTKCKKVQK